MEILKYLIFTGIITLIFVIYSEYSIGQILFRPDSSGIITLNLNSLAGFLANPFYRRDLWTWNTLDINYAFVLIYSLCIYYLF